jgi:anti-sigma factor RsiW
MYRLSDLMAASIQADRWRAYLLGRLSPTEREEVEASYMSDDRSFEEIEAMQDEIVRDYAAGELSAEDRRDFERYLEANPALREKVLIAQALRRTPTPAKPVEPGFLDRLRGWISAPPFQFATALGAAAAIAIAVAQSWQTNARLAASLAEQRRLRDEVTLLASRAFSPAVPLFVESGLTRNGGRPRLQLPPPNVPVTLKFAASPGAVRYRIRVETPEGDKVADGEGVSPEILLPGGVLRPRREYVVEIEAIAAGGAVTKLPSASFGTTE